MQVRLQIMCYMLSDLSAREKCKTTHTRAHRGGKIGLGTAVKFILVRQMAKCDRPTVQHLTSMSRIPLVVQMITLNLQCHTQTHTQGSYKLPL